MKGQITLTNLIMLLIVFFLFLAFLPALQPSIDQAVVQLQQNPSDITPLLIFIIQAFPFIILLAIVLTAINYATPRREI